MVPKIAQSLLLSDPVRGEHVCRGRTGEGWGIGGALTRLAALATLSRQVRERGRKARGGGKRARAAVGRKCAGGGRKAALDGFEGELTSSKWAKLAKCSQDTALRDIGDLVGRGILARNPGGGRSTSYALVVGDGRGGDGGTISG
jgi:hypothetical protein